MGGTQVAETRRVQGSWKGRRTKPKMAQNGVVGSMSCTRHLIQLGVISVHIPSLLCRRIEIPKTKGRKTLINFSLFYQAMSFPLFISEAPPHKIRLSQSWICCLFSTSFLSRIMLPTIFLRQNGVFLRDFSKFFILLPLKFYSLFHIKHALCTLEVSCYSINIF